MAAKTATDQVHQPPAKSPCLWPHLDDDIFHYPSSVPLFFLSTFPFPFFFLSSSFLLPFFFFSFLSYFLHFPSLFFTFPFLFSVPFPFLFLSFLLSISFPLPLLFLSSFRFLSFFLFLSSSSDGWMRCVKRRWAKTLQVPDIIFSWDCGLSPFTTKGSRKRLF